MMKERMAVRIEPEDGETITLDEALYYVVDASISYKRLKCDNDNKLGLLVAR